MPSDAEWMERACQLARLGEGHVEPNPMVGCVLVRDGQLLAEGYHARYGGPHAERQALSHLDQGAARGATAYVTLEPCCHYGKTPPCTEALIAAGVARVCCAVLDPFDQVAGRGVAQLRAAGIQVDVGCGQIEARQLMAPYLKRITQGLPFVIAKWAMSLDGRMATRTGDSRWISSEASRAHAHRIRGRMDAIIVGSRTAAIDDPLLTARPSGPRQPVRVVVDSLARLQLNSQLARTAHETPVLIWTSNAASETAVNALTQAGCRVVRGGELPSQRLPDLLRFLAEHYAATNVLVEGGGELLGHFFDLDAIDEIQVYIAPRLIGGSAATAPLSATGLERVKQRPAWTVCERQLFEEDTYIRARAGEQIELSEASS